MVGQFPTPTTGGGVFHPGGGGGGGDEGSSHFFNGRPKCQTYALIGDASEDMVGLYVVHNPSMTSFAAMAFRPQLMVDGALSYTHNPYMSERNVRDEETEKPQVMGMHAWGAQLETGGGWAYLKDPDKSRARGGVVHGGVLLTPPEFEMENYYSIGTDEGPYGAASISYFCVAPGVAFAAGTPHDAGGLQAKSVVFGQLAVAATNDPYQVLQLNSSRVTKVLFAGELDQGSGEIVVDVGTGGTGAVVIPQGTTAQRPSALAPSSGMMRMNTNVTSGADIPEWYDGQLAVWKQFGSDIGERFYDGAMVETINIDVIESGGSIILQLEAEGGGDLTARFGGISYTLDTTPADEVTLTAGSDTSPQINYVYVVEAGGTLTLTNSTTSFPATAHAPVATVFCQSAASLATDGAFKVHAWTDHIFDSSENGHLTHLNAKFRSLNATWMSGVEGSDLVVSDPDAFISTTAGVVFQLHPHTMPAIDMQTPAAVWIVNDPTTAYKRITTFDDITQDASGGVINNKYLNLILWGVVSEDTGDCKLFINLPTDTYNVEATAQDDANQTAVFSFPDEFVGTAFLIARYTVQAKDSGAWVQSQKVDLRGLTPSSSAGGGGTTTGFVLKVGDTMSGDLVMLDNVNLALGTGGDSTITYDGTNTTWNPEAVGSGRVIMQGNMSFVDNQGIAFGTGEDSQLFYDGTHTRWDMSGSLFVTGTGSFPFFVNTTSTFSIMRFQTSDVTKANIGFSPVGATGFAVYDSGFGQTALFTESNNLILGGTADSGDRLQVVGSVLINGDTVIEDNHTLAFGTGGDSTITYDGTNTQWDLQAVGTGGLTFSGGRVAVGGASPASGWMFDVASGLRTIRLGADSGAEETRTDATEARCAVGIYHYTNAEEPSALVFAANSNGTNSLNWGGGTTLMNAATRHNFYVGATSATLTGTLTGRMTLGGLHIMPAGVSGDVAASAALELTSTAKGFLCPRMNTTQRDAIGSPATGLLIFNTSTGSHQDYDGATWATVGGAGGGDLLADGSVPLSATWDVAGNSITSVDDLQLDDSGELQFGTGSDSVVWYDGSNTFWNPDAVGSGNLIIQGSLGIVDNEELLLGTGGDSSLSYNGTNTLWDVTNVGTGLLLITGSVRVDQSNAALAQAAMWITQADVDDTFINFVGTSAAGGGNSISSTTTETSTKFGAIQIEINGAVKWIRIYDTHA